MERPLDRDRPRGLGIAAVVFVEKLAPRGQHFARATGIVLLALALTEGAFAWPGI